MRRRIVFTAYAWEDYEHWCETDPSSLRRVNTLIAEAALDPGAGDGDPQPLQHILEGCWSRRIDDTHCLVYLADEDEVVVLQTRYHSARAGPSTSLSLVVAP
jgi:toxin YoeB